MDEIEVIKRRIRGIEEQVDRIDHDRADYDLITQGLDARVGKIEKDRPCKSVQAIQRQIIKFFPDQQRILSELKDGQERIFQLIGKVQARIDEHGRKIESLEEFATIETHKISEVRAKNTQWAVQVLISFVLIIGAGTAIFVNPELNNFLLYKLVAYGASGVLFGKILIEMIKTFRGLGG